MISKTYYRYIWLLNTFLDNGPLTFEEFETMWHGDPLSDGGLPLRTFHEHRKGIKELFGVDIECNKSDRFKYYVRNPEVLNQNRPAIRLLNAYSVPNEFATYNRMQDRILLEEMSKGNIFVCPIIEALQRDVVVIVDYQGYKEPHEVYHISPYALKAYNRQWYLLGHIEEKNAIRNIALNRIIDLKITNKSFDRPRNFDARKYYANTIGIFVNEDLPVETVKIRTYGIQPDYLRALPLHKSQQEVKTIYGEYTDFQYRLCITPELISTLLSMGENVEVLEPPSLKNQIMDRLSASIKRYRATE